jgi:hypothetical protein
MRTRKPRGTATKIDEKVTAKPRTDHQTDVSMLSPPKCMAVTCLSVMAGHTLIPPAEMSRIYVRHALSMEFLVKQHWIYSFICVESPRLLVEGIMPPCVFLSPSSVSCEGSFVWFVADLRGSSSA